VATTFAVGNRDAVELGLATGMGCRFGCGCEDKLWTAINVNQTAVDVKNTTKMIIAHATAFFTESPFAVLTFRKNVIVLKTLPRTFFPKSFRFSDSWQQTISLQHAFHFLVQNVLFFVNQYLDPFLTALGRLCNATVSRFHLKTLKNARMPTRTPNVPML